MRKYVALLGVISLSIAARAQNISVLYETTVTEKLSGQNVRQVEVAVQPQGAESFWIRLEGTKVDGNIYRVWFLADRLPFATEPKTVAIAHYILQETGREPVEYVDLRTGRAIIPLFDFVGQLIPRTQESIGESLFEKGMYLGLPIVRRSFSAIGDIRPLEKVERLELRGDLLIGTSRNFRDDGQPRKSKQDNYAFVPFTQPEYDEMIAAGINYFVVQKEQADWICHRPVYYEGTSKTIAFPEELYRPNFRGLSMFIDEPACILAGKYPPGSPLSTAVTMIQDHIKKEIDDRGYRNRLEEQGIALGELGLVEPQIPIWETYVETSWYQLQANRVGIIQECRWKITPTGEPDEFLYLQRINQQFGVEIPISPENLFLWSYSSMRGAARAFNAKWGMAIYGQAEPGLRYPSMQLAYDLGAEYLWFWTSDHDHHVPYAEQLALSRRISDYARTHPRDLTALRNKANTAIVLPFGYTLPTSWQLFTWGTHIYPLDKKNDKGLTTLQVLKPAIEEIARCLKDKIQYDICVAGDGLARDRYERIYEVLDNGTVVKK
ncbi:MAG: hypothetical protein GX455_11330 [Phycisphaerae bacterium]|nr:hypothetical protein [Phycisphaerae bacterium]